MRGVQREAGALRLASTSSTTGSPSRAEARSAGGACFRRRLLALLLGVPGLFTAAPGLVVAPTALLLGALSLVAPAPAAADVLVSNLGQSWWATSDYGNIAIENTAQQFTTGSNQRGYILNSVQVRASRRFTDRPGIVAKLWTSTNGAPGSELITLTPPASFPQGTEGPIGVYPRVFTFTAPANTVLSGNTSYFIVMYKGTGTAPPGTYLAMTRSASEDSGGLTGWSIANSIYHLPVEDVGNNIFVWRQVTGQTFSIRLDGSVVVPGAPTLQSVVPANGKLYLSWSSQATTETGYDVHYTSATTANVANDATASGNDASAAWVAVSRSGTTPTQTISSLSNGTAYRVRVRAKNSGGNGAWAFGTGTPMVPTGATVSFSSSTFTVTEGSATNSIMAMSRSATGATVTIPVTVTLDTAEESDIEAGALADLRAGFSFVSSAVTYSTRSIIPQHDTDTDDETFTVAIDSANLPTGYSLGSVTSAQVTIVDDDRAVSLSASPNPVTEGSSVTVTATLSEAAAATVTIPVTVTDVSAESGDHGALTSITVNAGATTGTGTITTNHDTGDNHETFTVSLGTLPTSYVAGAVTSVTITINDDDGVVLSVVGDPACGSTVTDMSVRPKVRLSATPPGSWTTHYTMVNAQGEQISTAGFQGDGWIEGLSIRGGGSSVLHQPSSGTFAELRSFEGFAGFKFRLRDLPAITAECMWQFDNSGRGTPTETTTTTTTITTTTTTTTPPPPRNPTIRGGGNPRDLSPSFSSASVPAQSYTEGTAIPPLVLPEARGGDGRLFYALSPSLPAGLRLNRGTRRLSGIPTTPQAARQYTWTATDADGDAARITFTVTVVPDLRPSFDNVSVPDQSYIEGTAITPFVLPEATGGNGPLTYALSPSLPNGLTLDLATRRLSGSLISPQAATLYTWTVTDADGDEATLTFTIAIAVDPHRQRVREAARRALAEMARRAMSGALDTIGARFGAVGSSGLSLAGQPVSLESVASVADGVGMAVWNNQSLALGELLGESAFSLHLAATGEAGDGEINSEGPLWSVWGRGNLASFAGGREEETHYDGWLRSGWLGLDARSGRWVGGMALSHEQGQADYGATMVASDRPLQGRLETSLTALYPYGRWQLTDGMELQGVVGVGWGEAHHTPADEQRETGTLSMRMASLGVRKSLPDVAGLALALRADAAVTRIETGNGPDTIHNLSADSWRLRTGLEASRRFSLEGEAFLEPFLEAAVRQDGGDGLEGSGVELAGGLRYSAPNVAVELRGRWLAAHSEEGAEEQGISLTARYGPGADGQGLFFALSPRWGAATGGVQALWGEDLPVLSTADAGNSGAVDAQVGYGFALPQGGVLTPFAEVGMAGSDSRRLRLGTRYAAAVTGLDMAVELAGERRESGDAAAEHALQLDVDLRF